MERVIRWVNLAGKSEKRWENGRFVGARKDYIA